MKVLIIQTAFIGDVILASALLEKIYGFNPAIKIDFLLRKGNESLLKGHPFLNEIIVWDKQNSKYKSLAGVIKKVRNNNYDKVINLHRFSSSGIITKFSKAKEKIGFDKNPWSKSFDKVIEHKIGEKGTQNYQHEVDRCLAVINHFTDNTFCKPKLYPSLSDYQKVEELQKEKYITIAPASVWFTKQFPFSKWIELINKNLNKKIFILGAPSDQEMANKILDEVDNPNLISLVGKISLLQSAALMKNAEMNFVNDSAPMHLCSAMNAPVTVFYCSTIPEFGFGPLSDNSTIIEINKELNCRPCGLHGYKKCPEGHFDCGFKIEIPTTN